MQPTTNNLPASQNNLLPELDLKVYLRILLHWSWLIIVCTLAAGVTAYFFSIWSVPIYQASTTLLINEARNATANYQDLLTSERIARTYAELMKRTQTLDQVAAEFKSDRKTLDQVISDISVTPVRDTQLLKVVVEGISPDVIAAVADTLPRVFIAELSNVQSQRFEDSRQSLQKQLDSLSAEIEKRQIALSEIGQARTGEDEVRAGQLRNELTQFQNSYANIVKSYEDLKITEAQTKDNIAVVEPAIIPTTPIRPRVLVNTLLAAIVGAMLALGVIFLIEYLDDRVKTPQDLHGVINTPILGAIAQIPNSAGSRGKRDKDAARIGSLITAHEPRHPITEAYRSLRTNLQFSSVDEPLHSFMLTSATPGEGKTTTAANLAVVMAQSGKSVILVDADMRKPQVHKIFELSKSPGLTDAMIATDAPLDLFLRETETANLRVLTCGKEAPNPAELLGSQRMQQLIQQLGQEADIVIFDAPPVLAVTDAQVLAAQVQGVLLVVNTEKTPRTIIARAAEALLHTNARLYGAVLNRLANSPRGYYYYYSSYSYYYADDEREDGDKRKRSANSKSVPSTKDKQPVPSNAKLRAQEQFASNFSIRPEVNGVYRIQPEKPS